MKLSVVLAVVALTLVGAYVFRYQYETQTVQGLSFTVRINRLTGDQCLYSGPGTGEIVGETLKSLVETVYGMPNCAR